MLIDRLIVALVIGEGEVCGSEIVVVEAGVVAAATVTVDGAAASGVDDGQSPDHQELPIALGVKTQY